MIGCMSTKAVSVEARLAIGAQVVLEEVSGASVTQICREYGISRDTYYRYRRRMLQEGVEGLVPRSTRPRNSPRATPADVVAVVVAKHDELVEQGWDGGALNRPGVSGGSVPWEGWSHVREYIEEVSGRAA